MKRLLTLLLLFAQAAYTAEPVTLLCDVGSQSVVEALVEAYQQRNPDVTIEIEYRPGGRLRETYIEARLETGTMTDIILYNSGSLFRSLNPEQFLVDLTDEPFQNDVIDSFKAAVEYEGRIYGAPIGTAMGGGILYNKSVYETLGLEVPLTWSAFISNNEKIKQAGFIPVLQSLHDTWTSQLIVLADYFNVQIEEPDFAKNLTRNAAKFRTVPAALRSFQRLQSLNDGQYLNNDRATMAFDQAIQLLVFGEAAHYPMLTFAIQRISVKYPDKIADIGFFPIPGDDPVHNGLTVWMPTGLYITLESEHIAIAKDFISFVVSADGCWVQTEAVGMTGPYLVKGCVPPATVPAAVIDMMPYFEQGRTSAALEFLSPLKGPALESISVEVALGKMSAKTAALLYDHDLRKRAQQLNLKGW